MANNLKLSVLLISIFVDIRISYYSNRLNLVSLFCWMENRLSYCFLVVCYIVQLFNLQIAAAEWFMWVGDQNTFLVLFKILYSILLKLKNTNSLQMSSSETLPHQFYFIEVSKIIIKLKRFIQVPSPYVFLQLGGDFICKPGLSKAWQHQINSLT